MAAGEEEIWAVLLGFRFSGTSKSLETQAKLDATLVIFLSGLFSHLTDPSPLFLSSLPPCLPDPLCLPVRLMVESWPFSPPPLLLPSLPYHHRLLTTTAPFPRTATSSLSLWTYSYSSSKTDPSASPLAVYFFFSFTAPFLSEGNTVRAGESLPAVVLVWQWPLMSNLDDPTHPPAIHAGSLRALLGCYTCCLCVQAEDPSTWLILTAGGIFGECYNKLDVQESTLFWRCQIQVYFPGDCKGHIFQAPSSKHGGTAAHKKPAGKIYFRWLKQCVFS